MTGILGFEAVLTPGSMKNREIWCGSYWGPHHKSTEIGSKFLLPGQNTNVGVAWPRELGKKGAGKGTPEDG